MNSSMLIFQGVFLIHPSEDLVRLSVVNSFAPKIFGSKALVLKSCREWLVLKSTCWFMVRTWLVVDCSRKPQPPTQTNQPLGDMFFLKNVHP